MSLQIQQIDMGRAPLLELEELAAFYEILDLDDMPDDPPQPSDARIAEWRNVPPHHPEFRWAARDEGQIVGVAVATYDTTQNLDNGFARVSVHPDHRRRGYGKPLARSALEHLRSEGRKRVSVWIKEGEPAEIWVEQLGLRSVYHEVRSRLRIDELDHAQMQTWIQRASERAHGYELRYFKTPVPEEILEDFSALMLVMNTAPREEFEEEDEVITPEMWRSYEKSVRSAGGDLHTFIAVERSTGAFAGYTTLNTQSHQPDLAWQWDTGVHPDHRNKGLGRWLKASMIERITAEYPAVTRVDTWNAGSNAPMLGINVEMGFRPVHISNTWQGDVDTAISRLGD